MFRINRILAMLLVFLLTLGLVGGSVFAWAGKSDNKGKGMGHMKVQAKADQSAEASDADDDEDENKEDENEDEDDDDTVSMHVYKGHPSLKGLLRAFENKLRNPASETARAVLAQLIEARGGTVPEDVYGSVADDVYGSDEASVTVTFKMGNSGVKIKNGRMMVQVNMLSKALGLQKSWDAKAKMAYFVRNDSAVAFQMGKKAIFRMNSTEVTEVEVDQGGEIIDNFTFATLRGVQKGFSGTLTWDNETKTATFTF